MLDLKLKAQPQQKLDSPPQPGPTVVHIINLISNVLSSDSLSLRLRRKLLGLLGIQLGEGTVVLGGSYFSGGRLVTGAGCYINRGCYFDFNAQITLGNNVVIGHGVTLITAEHAIGDSSRRAGPVSGRPIAVKDGAWIGANATLLPGVVIGQGSIVAAGAVVTKDVSANVVVAGVPAKVVRELESE